MSAQSTTANHFESWHESAGWRPIETAPKDGTPILVGTSDGDVGTDRLEITAWCSIENYHWDDLGDNLYRKVFEAPYEFWNNNGKRATHWMPLPPSPTSSDLSATGQIK